VFVRRKEAEREEARRLRAEGLSVRRIATRLGVAKSSVSVWVRDVEVTVGGAAAPPSVPAPPAAAGLTTRRCGRCSRTLPETDFNRSGNGRQHWCRACFAAYFRERGDVHRRQVRRSLQARRTRACELVRGFLAARSCVDCGEDEILVLEFDHCRGEKEAGIARLVYQGVRPEVLRRELERCEVVCVNCHRRRTARRAGSFRVTGVPRPSWEAWQTRNQRRVVEVLRAAGCTDCGEAEVVVLDFDHVGEKTAIVSRLAVSAGAARLEREMAACVVRCGNCHRLKTLSRAGSYRDPNPWW
jgi:AcrR family transcriptional regulator